MFTLTEILDDRSKYGIPRFYDENLNFVFENRKYYIRSP